MPLCPLLEAKSAAVRPGGSADVGSSTAPGAAPNLTRAITVSSLERRKHKRVRLIHKLYKSLYSP